MTRKTMKQALAAHKARKARENAATRIERKIVAQEYWIESAREDEWDDGPYRICTTGGQPCVNGESMRKHAVEVTHD